MVQQLVRDMLVDQLPQEAREDVELAQEDPAALVQIQFFTRSSGSATSHDLRYHCTAADDTDVIACGRIEVANCANVGSFLPDVSLLCKHCARARPDVAALFQPPA